MKRRHTTAFYLETLILIVVFIGIILVLTRIFGLGKRESDSARILTNAVTLSENAAEAFSASLSPQQLAMLLDVNGNAVFTEESRRILATYDSDMTPDPAGDLTVDISWDPAETESGKLVSGQISVWYRNRPDPVYTMDTAVFIPEVTS